MRRNDAFALHCNNPSVKTRHFASKVTNYDVTTKSRYNDFLHCVQPEHALHSFHPGTASKDVAAVLESLATLHQTVAPGANKDVIQDRQCNQMQLHQTITWREYLAIAISIKTFDYSRL